MGMNEEIESVLESRNSIPFYRFLGLTRDSFDLKSIVNLESEEVLV